ncbi:excinuclease ABC subunit C [Lacibacter cauensis]|uniref:UvrABC system protein C n=1 Tax=Lacibacter cauensis TaxID=510947 RepID=A0A562SQL5_9BACT|nr:excinuclease ABC subunit UvrC [Lacibacter cauensis]TWI83423.1 excinuclease ABC subunit C [Lacibacter cauensis]
MTEAELKKVLPGIPAQPGIYKYYDADKKLLYVGKAKHLRKRVSSYFTKTLQSYKTQELVRRIRSIEFTVVNSEQDAFFLENSLIKQFQPVFNIDLKDDKSYPFIVIKNEPFPRVFLTRKKINDGSTYLGPFTSVAKVRDLIDFIRQHIPIRNCKLNLAETQLKKGKYKVCLEYHLGNCKGPCERLQTEADYRDNLEQVKNILKGNLSPVIRHLKEEMKQFAADLNFEKAEINRKKIEHLENYRATSTVVNPKLGDADVISLVIHEEKAFLNYMMVQNGSIIQTENLQLESRLGENEKEILEFAVSYIRNRFESISPELIVPVEIELLDEQLKITVPKAGEKKKLLELSQKNAAIFFEEYKRKKALQLLDRKKENNLRILEQLQKDLHLPQLPLHIECFDNSNFQGSYPVSAMVCFKNGEPSKNDYRKFNIKTVQGINDFASMKEVVMRRYKRLTEEDEPLPQLVIIDGGKGQLSSAMESIKALQLENKMTVVGLAKNVEEIFFTGDQQSLKLDYNGESLRLIRSIRDEVHRFGITFHRAKRSKGTFKTELDTINGIGEATATLLLNTFKSVKNIRTASVEELTKVVGESKAMLVKKALEDAEI